MTVTKKEISQKLKVDEYVFEIEKKDIINAFVTYKKDYDEITSLKDGKKTIIKKPVIEIKLSGEDINSNEAWISFYINTNINYLNTLSKLPTNISHLLESSDAFIKRPDEKQIEFLNFDFPQNNENDIYKMFSSLWISKLKENKFIFKLFVPNLVFTYFQVEFI